MLAHLTHTAPTRLPHPKMAHGSCGDMHLNTALRKVHQVYLHSCKRSCQKDCRGSTLYLLKRDLQVMIKVGDSRL